jgi:hypothetical protein
MASWELSDRPDEPARLRERLIPVTFRDRDRAPNGVARR